MEAARFVRIRADERYSSRLREQGFEPFDWVESDGGITSPSPCRVPTTTTSRYLWPTADVLQELRAMDNGSTIRTQVLGQSSAHSSGPRLPIVGVQFGPLTAAPTSRPPTLYLVGNIHAREWAAMSVSLGVARYLRNVINGTVSDPTLKAALADTAIAVIPLPNPVGYEYSRTTDRFHRNNLNTTCLNGVDLNRNFETSWADNKGASRFCGSDIYKGRSPASEDETLVLQKILSGLAFELPQTPAGVISYHTYGGLVLYPDGRGSDCETDESYCWNPDFQVLRRMFGDTHDAYGSPPFWTLTNRVPYLRGQSTAVLYPVSGSLTTHAMFQATTGDRVPAITPELTSQYTQFEYECTVTNPDVFVDDLVSRQLAPLKRALSFFVKQKHATASPVTADIGSYASGIMTRDHTSKWAHDDRRAVFVKPVWLPLSTGSLTGRFDGATVSYQYGRSASLYDLYYLDRKTPGWNELGAAPLDRRPVFRGETGVGFGFATFEK